MELMIAQIVHREFLPPQAVAAIALALIALAWGVVMGYLIGRASTVKVLTLLRTALIDAYMGCIRCHGSGVLQIPGATVRCPNCSRWRMAVEAATDGGHTTPWASVAITTENPHTKE